MTRNNGRGGLHWIVLAAALLAGGCAGMMPVETLPDQYYFWQVHSPDRSDADRIVDQRRQPEARNLDLVTFNFVYHDTAWLGTDRMKMNRAVFDALKPGGVYIVADHSGRPGTGISEAKSLHRIEESVVRREVEAAGFKLAAEAGFLRNPADPRDASVFKPQQPNDEFVLKFVKP